MFKMRLTSLDRAMLFPWPEKDTGVEFPQPIGERPSSLQLNARRAKWSVVANDDRLSVDIQRD